MSFSADEMVVSNSFIDEFFIKFSIPYMDGRCEYTADAHLTEDETKDLIQYLSKKLTDANKGRSNES